MARISGVTIPDAKQVQIALTYVYGIGPKTSADILAIAKVDPTTRVKNLTDGEISSIQDAISANYTVEGELQRVVATNIKRLRDIKSYRGERHAKGLPSRGQRTRTNGRTRRGKRIAVGGAQPKSASKT
ncbi:30S ribosomal protein S13 [Patescibacteria group bacterium]|nr:MAG: 30S ribosomal protein S13 [Patescibacteria group bacterium]